MAKKIKIKKEASAEEATKVEEAKALEAQGIQDEFQAKGFELVEWVHENTTAVVAILAVVLVLGFAFAGYNLVSANRDADASAAYATALKAYDAPLGDAPADEPSGGPRFKDATERAKASRDLFQKVVDEHKGTGAAALAQLYIGNASMKLDDHDRAVTAFRAFLDGTSQQDPLRFAGLSGLAAAAEAKGDVDGAIKALNDLVDLPGKIDEDAALLGLGRLYRQKGDPAKAKAALERLVKDFPESSLKIRGEEALAGLSTDGAAPASPSPAVPSPTPAQ
jgi:tetratricopeptide (TPR) repeat protein